MKSLQDHSRECRIQIETLNDQMKSMALDIVNLNKKIEKVRFEPTEKIKRRNNIVIRGLLESSDINDTDMVLQIL